MQGLSPKNAVKPRYGPLLVGLGASLWGTETLWRQGLNQVMPPDAMVFYEHAIFLLFSLPWIFTHWTAVKRITWPIWAYLVASGVLGSALGAYFFTIALKSMNASVANALLHLQPIISIGFAMLLLGERPRMALWPWALMAIVAGLLLPINGLSHWPWQFNFAALADFKEAMTPAVSFIGLTAMCWGFSTVAGRAINTAVPLGLACSLRMVIGFITMGVVIALKQQPLNVSVLLQPGIALNVTILAVFAGMLPLFLYFKGLSQTSASVASFWETMQVVAALGVSWFLLGDALMPHQVLATLVLIVAVYNIDLIQHRTTGKF